MVPSRLIFVFALAVIALLAVANADPIYRGHDDVVNRPHSHHGHHGHAGALGELIDETSNGGNGDGDDDNIVSNLMDSSHGGNLASNLQGQIKELIEEEKAKKAQHIKDKHQVTNNVDHSKGHGRSGKAAHNDDQEE